MYEMYKLDEVIENFKIKLKDFSLFKKYVKYNSKLNSIVSTLIAVGTVFVLFNLFATVNAILKNSIPFDYFFDLFFDMQGDTSNLVLTLLSILGFVFLIIAIILKIFSAIKKDSNYKRIYNEFISTTSIIPKRTVLISNSYYLIFKDESDAERMITLLSSGTFDDDKKYKMIIKDNKFQTRFSYLSNYLKKNFGFNNVIESVFHSKFNNNSLKCESGDFQLFVEAYGLHLIKISEINKDN